MEQEWRRYRAALVRNEEGLKQRWSRNVEGLEQNWSRNEKEIEKI